VRLLLRWVSQVAALNGALLLATFPPLAVWSTSGLETMPFALCVFATFACLCAPPPGESTGGPTGSPAGGAGRAPRGIAAGAFAALAVLLRADGFAVLLLLFGSLAICALAARGPSRGQAPARAGALANALFIASCALVTQLFWRWSYYGELAPNTAHAKVAFAEMLSPEGRWLLVRGFNYVASYFLTFLSAFLVVLLIAPACLATPARAVKAQIARAAALFCAGLCAYAIVVSGDFMAMGRFLVPAIPFAAIVFSFGIERIERIERLGAFGPAAASLLTACAVVLSLMPAFNVHPAPRELRERFHFRYNEPAPKTELEMWSFMRENAREWKVLGRALADHTRPGESITLGPIGAVGYYSGLTIYDSYGLVDRAVAKARLPRRRASPGHDVAVPLSFFDARKPTYLVATLAPSDDPTSVLPRDWREDPSHLEGIELEVKPLDPQRFAPNTSLLLLRHRWSL
jgi:hypothetical protein